jgi:hypothetical protein
MEELDKDDLIMAMNTCYELANYIKETEPQATLDITTLENAAEVFDAFANIEAYTDEEK